jgi:hypothetical protein
MKSLMQERYVPITYQIGFLEGNFEQIARVYLNWRQTLQPAQKFEFIREDLERALERLEPLTTPWEKELLIATKTNWVAFFCNGLRGCDPESPIGHLCTIVPCRGVVVHCVPDRSDVRHPHALRIYGAVSFTLFGPYSTDWLNQERYVCTMNDGGKWAFFNQGQLQPFERPERYKMRRIRDRFTPQMLEEYCAALGIQLFDESFYGGNGLITQIPNQLVPDSPVMSLEEARKYTLIR